MASQRGQQGGIRSGRHDDVNIAGSNYPFLSQYIVQVNQQGRPRRSHPEHPQGWWLSSRGPLSEGPPAAA